MSSTSEGDATLRRRIQQQEEVARFGQLALETNDLEQLLADAASTIADTLGNEYGAVFDLDPDDERALLRRGVGWSDDRVGAATVPAASDCQPGRALEESDPVIVADRRTDDRFDAADLFADHGVVSGVSARIGSADDPWGVLGTYATEPQAVSEHDANFVQSIANVLATAIENRRTKRELETLHDRITDAFYSLNADWEFTYLNDRAAELIDFTGEGLRGETIWDVFEWGADSTLREEYERALETQESTSFEFYYPEPLETWFEVHAYPSETGLSVYFRDVTERVQREHELEQTERRFEAIFEDPNILVGLLEPDGTVIDINGTAMAYIDADLEAVRGEPFWETPWWGEGDDVGDDVREWTERAAAGEYVEFEADLTRPDGNRYTLEGTFRPVTDDDGDVVSIIVSDRDVSERKRRERQLRKSEQRHRTLAENFPNGIVTMFDEERRYTLAAGRMFDELPVSPSDVEGAYVGDVWPDHVSEPLEEAFEAALAGERRATEFEYAGREWIVRAVPITDDNGDVFSGITIAQDITERKEYQRKLEESNERLEQFAYAASHDLQEPLRMVSSYLRLIDTQYGDAFDADGEEFLAFAVDGADRMREMIDGLLEYSRIETRGDPLEPIDLNAVLADVLDDLRLQIEDTDAEIDADALPTVEGDASQLRQVFQNLLSNALEYSGDEPPRVRIDAERRGDRWVITVADEGIGMDPDEADRVFEVFQRLHSHSDHQGTGIGLALCERIVERHGGDIWVDSEPDEGATFSFTLPAVGNED
ncbi:PAS domain-containing protein [Halopiger xanaduensis]|uniref:histidine kinase n=1 Tax=Halopiger xanaduensis (strain DSM 18323 / JCM 14033 / SH-6) TaxID=797210 RepID=F8DBQ5_HALXS|nr:PAS domain-containing protein [Halopiger xanaduensis]AEH38325.1 multi-sensor signal transduction histidine kinase [Halopiger xanaduensis SH-6]